MPLFLIRHPRPLIESGVCYGQLDVEAEDPARLADQLAARLPARIPIISSPLRRARVLAEALGKRLDAPVHDDPRLREIDFGNWEGQRWEAIDRALLDAWAVSRRWNDLRRVPSLSCEQTGSWDNDPAATRRQIMALLAQLQPGQWLTLDDFVAAVQRHAPDFQRPDGNYDTWYVRTRGGAFLRGFEQWLHVEGALLRFVLGGPLAWLGATNTDDPAQPTAFCLSAAGHAWLHRAPPPAAAAEAPLQVQADFTVLASPQVVLLDRLRVARFTTWQAPQWQAGAPCFVYRISQSGLQRAQQQGISPGRVLDFLRSRAQPLPDNVIKALERREKARQANSAAG